MLPFVQAPAPVTTRRVGNDASGILEIPVRGGLTVDESNTISDLLAAEQSTLVAGAKLADAIAAEEGISITEAFQIIENTIAGRPLEPAADTIRLKNAERIAEVHRIFDRSSRLTTVATVTALIRHRLNLPNWGVNDTSAMAQVLLDDIYVLALDEQKAENMPAAPPTEDDLKKPPAEPRRQTKRTGKKSSGT